MNLRSHLKKKYQLFQLHGHGPFFYKITQHLQQTLAEM